jgi:hypothetical protein
MEQPVKNLWNYLKPPTPTALQLAVAGLEDAQCQKLEQSKLCEYHSAMEDMLAQRIDRLRREITDLTQEQQ